MIAIAGIGLCTAQGSARQILQGGAVASPGPLPWPAAPRSTCDRGFLAKGIDPALRGMERWQALAVAALGELGLAGDVPIIVGSCNGAADEPDARAWLNAFEIPGIAGPIASAACASGLHALWLAVTQLRTRDQVIVLAVDTLSRTSHAHFEGLRVLANEPAPWQPASTGFLPGEAAVALHLVRARAGDGLPRLVGPVLAHDREGVDALGELVSEVAKPAAFIVGQGTGPVAVDRQELAAIAAGAPPMTPLTSALEHFGHTVGASGLLSVALATLASRHELPALALPHRFASDGRPLATERGDALVVCRALGGACAVTAITEHPHRVMPSQRRYGTPARAPALRLPILRRLASEALAHRPVLPPAALIVRLAAPLVPPDDARIGGRLLPSVILEITPGFVAQLVARAWSYGGPALCLVGGSDEQWLPLLAECRAAHGSVAVIHVHERDIEWNE